MELTDLIQHPEDMDSDSLYELRSILALYPYSQTARILLLQNLYLLRDPSFDEELRRAAIYITDRTVLFDLIEAAHYMIKSEKDSQAVEPEESDRGERTSVLIDEFLDSIPEEKPRKDEKRKPTPADATVDYVAYLLESESGQDILETSTPMKGQSLIDKFIDDGKFKLDDTQPETSGADVKDEEDGEGYFTETLARIYIKQGKYEKALEVMRKLETQLDQKNDYLADQMRFLKKLIINDKNKKVK